MILARLLARRGVETAEQARAFLNPSPDQLRDPFDMPGMARAAEVIGQTVRSGGRVTIFGDYDADGICAAALLSDALRRAGAEVSVCVPERHGEGYGLTIPALERLRPGCALLVTVDCGITAVEESRWARANGLRLVVTDHHEPGETLPYCEALVDPMLDSPRSSPLCGAGVAFKLVQALYGWSEAARSLDLAALATVADVVPMLGENRALAALGVEAIRRAERVGMRALIEAAGLAGKPLNAGHVGFQLAPRLNSAGRVGSASRNIDMLLTDDPEEARAIAAELNERNERRQSIQRALTKDAEARALELTDFRRDRIVAPDGLGWNTGVIGLAASSLTERYHMPTIVFAVHEKDGVMMATGSARAVPGVHIQRAMSRCADLFTRFGGHAQAAGCSLPADRLPELRERLNRAVVEQADPEAFIPSARYDEEIALRDLTMSFLEDLRRLEPHGTGNPAPSFLIRDAKPVSVRKVGADRRHLKLRFLQDGASVDGVAFGQAEQIPDRLDELPARMDALARGAINDFMGIRAAQFIAERLMPTDPLEAFEKRCLGMRGRFERELAERVVARSGRSAAAAAMPRDALRARVGELLRSGYQGTLLAARTLAAALDWSAWLRRSGLGDRVDCHPSAARDPRAFHALAALPELSELPSGYDRIIFLDIPPNDDEVAIIRHACPDALIWLDNDAREWEAAAAELALPEERLRELFRSLSKTAALSKSIEESVSLRSYAEALGAPEASVYLGLRVFAELGFIRWTEEPFECAILSKKNQSKRLLGDSELYRRCQARRGPPPPVEVPL
jgi:single-stranded-DNA-specific exonuclease